MARLVPCLAFLPLRKERCGAAVCVQAYLSLYLPDVDAEVDAAAGSAQDEQGDKARKSFDFALRGSRLKIDGSCYGNLMLFINDYRRIQDEANAAFVQVQINGFPIVVVVARQVIQAGYVSSFTALASKKADA